MALLHLTDEQISTWTRAQKDEWWFKNVFRGDMPQLTIRSAVFGFLLGGILSGTALYIGARSGIGIGVGLTSVLLSFALFRALHNAGITSDFTILENNCTQSIATAAGYMNSPLITSLTAYMVITGTILPWWQMLIWMIIVSILGVLVAFPMKRRFINDEQLPFPEGRASGVVLDSLYTGGAAAGLFKTRLLIISTTIASFYGMLTGDGWMKLIQFKILGLDKRLGWEEPWTFHEHLDQYYYEIATKIHLAIPRILGTDIRQLGWHLTLDFSFAGIGGLMGIRVASSCMLGAIINFVILGPIMIQRHEIVERVSAAGKVIPINRAEIVNQWSLWWAVAIMVVGSLIGLLARPEMFTSLFKSFKKKNRAEPKGEDILRDIEFPMWISYVGVPIFGFLGAWVTHMFFNVPWLLSFISLPLIFVLTVICTNAMALTSWTPTGALSKITQFSIGAIDRSNPANNLLPAGMTSEISANAANLLSDIKPGYMLGAKPRQQAVGHVIGIVSGAFACVGLFNLLFLQPGKDGVVSTANIISDKFAFPSVLQWKGVAELIAKGLSHLPTTALIAMGVAALSAVVIEILRIRTKGRFPLSAVSIGLGVVLPPDAVLAMWLGAMLFWAMGRKYKEPETHGYKVWVDGCEPICAGLISGAALIGIGDALLSVFL